jgi:hypothetical protein
MVCSRVRCRCVRPPHVPRLSDFLFVAARFASLKAGCPEHVYKKAAGVVAAPAV